MLLFIAFIITYQNWFDVYNVSGTFVVSLLEIKPNNVIINFYGYTSYLSAMFIFTLPFAIKNSNKYMLIISVIIGLLLEFVWKDHGEMGFGSFNILLNKFLSSARSID